MSPVALAENWYTDGTRFLRRNRDPISLRNSIPMGTLLTRDMVGCYPGTVFTTLTGAQTYATAQVILNTRFEGLVRVTGPDVTFINCQFVGPTGYPTADQFLASTTAAGVLRAKFIDCEFDPQVAHWNQDSGITGHDYTMTRCYLRRCTDNANVYNTAAASRPYAANVEFSQCLFDPMGWWTATGGGVVHPTDKATHNDSIQLQGGTGIKIWGCTFYAYYEPNYAHLKLLSGSANDEVWNLAAAGSQAASGPSSSGWPYASPPDRGMAVPAVTAGTRSTGRYNGNSSDTRPGNGIGSLSAIMVNANVGPTWGLDIQYNNMFGGIYNVNCGIQWGQDSDGITYPQAPAGIGVLIKNNKFAKDMYDQRTDGLNPATIVFNPSWAGHVDAGVGTSEANIYLDGSGPVLVRGI